MDVEATSPSPPAPAEVHIEEVTDSCPVTPVTPLCCDQSEGEGIQCNGVHSSNNNNNNTTEEEPVVADINNIEHPSDLELQYTIADVNILDTTDILTTTNLSSPQPTKSDNFQDTTSSDIDKPVTVGAVGMYRVDTSDKPDRVTNGHSSESSAKDEGTAIDSVEVTNTDITSLRKLASKEFDIVMKLESGEKRFGFSVIGGVDQGFPARVESIAGG